MADATTGGPKPPGAPVLLPAGEDGVVAQGPSRIDLKWTAPGEDDTGGADITGYKIEYSDSEEAEAGVPANSWRNLVANTGNVKLTYTDDGSVANLDEGDKRWYRVSAINSAGAGMPSDPIQSAAIPAEAKIATSAPTGLTARAMGPTQINLSWTAPTDTSGDEITGYMIEYSDLDAEDAWGNWNPLKTNTGNDKTTYTDDGPSNETVVAGLSAEDSRQYRVKAIIVTTEDGALTSPSSNVAAATTAEATVPGKPNMPMLTVPTLPTGAQTITVTWVEPTNTGGDAIAGYRIERSESMSTWPAKPLVPDTSKLDNNPIPPAPTLSYTDITVPKANTRWYYRVSAINPEGVGEPSDAAFGSTRPAAIPGAPSDLTAWEEGPTRIVLNWKAPAMTGGEVTGYKIEYSNDPTFDTPAAVLVANTMSAVTTYTDNGSVAELKAGDTRYYQVLTINSADTSAGRSDPASAISGTVALQPPTRLTATNTGQKSITLNWAAPSSGAPRTGYMVERSKDGRIGWEEVTDASFRTNASAISHNEMGLVVALELSTRYYYRVSTVDADRRSRPSNVADATTGGPKPPGAPVLLPAGEDVEDGVVAQGPSRIDLKWTAPGEDDTGGADITGYKIEYSDSEEAEAGVPANSWRNLVANTGNVKLTYTDDGSVANLDEGDKRWYRVSAINSAGAGMPSDPIQSAAIPAEAKIATSAPTGLTARAMGPTQINLSWTAPTDTSGDEITGYEIEYSNLLADDEWDDTWRDLKTNTGNDKTTYTDDGPSNETVVAGLSAEDSRQYRVKAIIVTTEDGALTSPSSNVAAATTAEATVPGKPNMPMLSPTGAQTITVTWVEPTNTGGDAIAGYRIERSESMSTWPAKPLVPDTSKLDNNPIPPAPTLSYTDITVPKANTRWYYRVSAINPEGVGEPSDAAFAFTSPAAIPGAPSDLTAWEEGPTRIVLNWQAPKRATDSDLGTGGEITGYKIDYSNANATGDDSDGMWMVLVADTGNDKTTYTDHGSVAELGAGTIRYYRVSAINSVDTSATMSNVYSAVTGTMAVALTVDGPDTASLPENSRDTEATYMVSGPDADKATWSTEGADARYFTITGGILNFRSAPDFEMPRGQARSATNTNEYMVTVKASYGTDMDEIMVTVTVGNVEEPGTVTLSPMVPTVGTEITATLVDEDIVTPNTVMWRWSRSTTMDGTYMDIDTATSMTYTPVEADVGYFLKATASYDDGEGTGRMAMENTASTVTVTVANPLLVKYDRDGDGIDRGDVIRAIERYFAEAPGVTRAEIIELIGLYFAS